MPGFAPPQHSHQDGQKVQNVQAGIWWPAADSEKLRAAARAWREMARALDSVQTATQAAALNVAADNDGTAMAAFAAYWQKWSGANGYLPACSEACLAMANALDQYAKAVDDARRQVEELVAEVATAVVIGVALSVLTVGISDVAADAVSTGLIISAANVGLTLSTAAADIVATVLVGAVFGAVDAAAIDAGAIQPERIWLFHDQKDFNWSEVFQWAEMGAAGGIVGGTLGVSISAAGDAVLPESVANLLTTRLGRVAVGGLSGAGTSAFLDEVQYGQVNGVDVLAGAVGGGAGGEIGTRRIRFRIELSNGSNDDLSAVGSDVHPNVPPYDGPPLRGILRVGNVEVPLKSSETGPGTWLTDNLEGGVGSGLTRAWTHVEGHAVGLMNEFGIKDADLYISKPPCGPSPANCRFVLYKLLPEGATLRVHFPAGDGTVVQWTFTGGVPGWVAK
jgi:nucleic acid/nucleotide deaminase of polymorphic system toxin